MPEGNRFAQVMVDIASASTDRVFTYKLPVAMHLLPGTRVLVPFGHKTIEGVVLGLVDSSDLPEDKIKPIHEVLEDYPAILPPLIELAREISNTSHCPLAMSLRLMFPAEMRAGRVRIKTQQVARLAISQDGLQEALDRKGRTAKQKLLLGLLSDGLAHPLGELRVLAREPKSTLQLLEQEGLVHLAEEEVFRSPYPQVTTPDPEPVLTPGQEETLSEILPAIKAGHGSFLLHGVTGSGKTEVYIRAARQALAQGKGVIVLIPEIVLTPQMVTWFRGRFGDVAAVLHSRLSAGERFDEWRRIRAGAARLVIGARSAVFAPVMDLGLIVIDEEHEPSYQADNLPRYDARDVAASRVNREGGVLLLASATPSILSFARARRGDMMLLEMQSRVNQQPLAQVHLVDMREELRLGNRGMFSGLLMQRLSECLQKGQQAMLFINRRGYAGSVLCRKCGEALTCSQCDVKLTYHQVDHLLHCHYCGLTIPMPSTCPACNSTYIKLLGTGTQKVEEELHKLFPGVTTVRMDTDTTTGKDAHQTLINRFRSGQAQVMIGTQMIAKGLDFPQVTLVGAILADMSLHMPDYRAQERTFQLLTQVAGRAGRADLPGCVVIQTYKPEHYAIQAAASQDYRAFFAQEFDRRRKLLYPPFTMLVRLLCEAPQMDQARQVSASLEKQVKDLLASDAKLKRPVLFVREDEAPIKRLFGQFRAQVLLKMLDNADSQQVLIHLQTLSEQPWPCRVSLEVNPASLA